MRLNKSGWELTPAEQLILDAVVRFTAPSAIFEFGTLTGSGTVLLADAAPDGATVHTVDVPDEYFSGDRWWAQAARETMFTSDMVGREFKTNPEYQNRIVQHRADLARFDVTTLRSAVDLVFVDDGHTYGDVSRDSRLAFEMVAPGGCII